MLENNIRKLRGQKRLLLMPHLVLGYPSFEENEKLIATMIGSGADIIEMQIPFSEPMADGPVILKANDEALKKGTTTTKCMDFARNIVAKYPNAIFLFMTYYNIPFAYGLDRFVKTAKDIGIQGLIVPDLPPEEASEYLAACEKHGVAPIFLFTPTSKTERLKELDGYSKGMIYCVGRKGVTGIKTKMDDSLNGLVKKYKSMTKLPLGLGFGIQNKEDIKALPPEVDIAIIGTKILTLHQSSGPAAVGEFIKELNQAAG